MTKEQASDIIVTDRQTSIGNDIINILFLKVKANGRVDTGWGDKTPLGLYLTLQRIMSMDEVKG